MRGKTGSSNALDGRYDSGKVFRFGQFEPPSCHQQCLVLNQDNLSNAPDGRCDSGKIFPFGRFEPPSCHQQCLVPDQDSLDLFPASHSDRLAHI